METVAPLFPWHGIWHLVSAEHGQPVPGQATIGTERLRDGEKVLTAGVDQRLARAVVYSLSGSARPGACSGACAVRWMPVLTTGAPLAADGVSTKDLGVAQRADGTDQVSYKGRPLYLYSLEKFSIAGLPGVPLSDYAVLVTTGTAGNGSGLPGPGGATFSVIPIP